MRVALALLLLLHAAPAAAAPASQPARAAIVPVLWSAPDAPKPAVAAVRRALEAAAPGRTLLDLSPAAEPPATAAERLRAGIVLYDRLRQDEARAALDEAAADATARGAAGLTPAELSDVYLYRALCAHVRGDATRAWDDFVRAAVVAPGRVLDPARFPPKAVAMMRRAKDEVAAAPRGTLSVVAPGGARVFVDAADAGVAPAQVPALPYGQHLVRVEHPGHATWVGVVHMAATAQRLEPPLRRLQPPDDLAVAAAARDRGASHALLAVVTGHDGGARLEVRLVDQAGQRPFAERTRAADAATALARAVATVREPGPAVTGPAVPPARPRPPTPWYQRAWVWAVVGAVVVSASVAIPLAVIERSPASGFSTRLDLGSVRR
jgi:DNA-directed RNA polymerase subunit K/omega